MEALGSHPRIEAIGEKLASLHGRGAVAQNRWLESYFGDHPCADSVRGFKTKLSDAIELHEFSKQLIEDAFNAQRLIEFLEALVTDGQSRNKKVFLILDNLRVHHSKLVKAWLAERKDKIEVFYLPSYSPELNPDERLNADLKHAIGSKVPARTKAKLKAATTAHMQMLEKNPDRVPSYFGDPRVAYAA